jgi:hypothetical protein
VPTNIVEGTARYHRRETLHFLRIAWGSLQEVGYLIHVAKRLEYISEGSADDLTKEVRQVAAPLIGLISSFDVAHDRYKPRKRATSRRVTHGLIDPWTQGPMDPRTYGPKDLWTMDP